MLVIPEKFRNFNYVKMVSVIQEELKAPHVIVVKNRKDYLPQSNHLHSYDSLLNVETSIYDEEQVSADDPLVVLFTSGTESVPKGVIHTHNTVLYGERVLAETLSITKDDAVLMASQLSHSTGFLRGVNLPLLVGAKSVLMDQFIPREALKTISVEKCTFSMGATPFLHDLLNEISNNSGTYNLSSFRFFLCGGV